MFAAKATWQEATVVRYAIASASPRYKLVDVGIKVECPYVAAGIGLLAYVIRTWGGYPDAVAFAVLLGNMCAPAIDYWCRPRADS